MQHPEKSENHDDKRRRSRIVFVNPLSAYKRLNPEDRGHVNTLIAVVILAGLAFGVSSYIYDDKAGLLALLSSIFMGVLVGASFSFFHGIGIVAPIEERMDSILDKNLEQLDTLRDIAEEVSDYMKYSNARKRFGFNTIVGELHELPSGEWEIKRDADEFALRQFRSIGKGSFVRFMNTYMESGANYYYAVEEAVIRGADIRMLLMFPDAAKPAFINRYNDCIRSVYHDRSIEDAVDYVKGELRLLDGLALEMANRRAKGEDIGTFELRYYCNSLNMPLLIRTGSREGADARAVAFSGYYGLVSSEAMPYIVWRGGDFGIIQKFIDLFDRKWASCEITHFLPQNDPAFASGEVAR